MMIPDVQITILTGPMDLPRIQVFDKTALERGEVCLLIDLDLAGAQALAESLMQACEHVEDMMPEDRVSLS